MFSPVDYYKKLQKNPKDYPAFSLCLKRLDTRRGRKEYYRWMRFFRGTGPIPKKRFRR